MKQADHYRTLKSTFESGELRHFRDIPAIVPITILARDMGLTYPTLCKRLLDPGQLNAADILRLSELIDVDPERLLSHILGEVRKYR